MEIHAHGTGFTLFELAVALAIATILLGLAGPSFEQFGNRQRMKAAVAGLQQDLLAARSQAVFRSTIVVACPGGPDAGCSGGSDWSNGWIVFEDTNGDRLRQAGEPLLRHGQPPDAITITAPPSRPELRFFPDGTTPGSNGSIELCGRDGPPGARKLVISNIGRIRRDRHEAIDPALCPA